MDRQNICPTTLLRGPELKRRAIPVPVQADGPEDEVLSSADRRNALADEF